MLEHGPWVLRLYYGDLRVHRTMIDGANQSRLLSVAPEQEQQCNQTNISRINIPALDAGRINQLMVEMLERIPTENYQRYHSLLFLKMCWLTRAGREYHRATPRAGNAHG